MTLQRKARAMTDGQEEGSFWARHIGPDASEIAEMLEHLGYDSLNLLTNNAVPEKIQLGEAFELSRFSKSKSESAALKMLKDRVAKNKSIKSFIGMGYHRTVVPPVIQRNILENPGWYTQYTPYQPEISQGRLEALLNYQTMICELTGLPIANASLLDEGTAAAEAVSLSYGVISKKKKAAKTVFVSKDLHPQTIGVVRTRAESLGLKIVLDSHESFSFEEDLVAAVLPGVGSDGKVFDLSSVVKSVQEVGALATVVCDILSLVLLKTPGEYGADIAVGNTQRFGVPMGFGGPHAAFIAIKDEFKRLLPGRLVGVSKDREGRPALRLTLQTREQHIRRERATSNICTAQVLLAVMAGMYAVYHGPKGLKKIANGVLARAQSLADALSNGGFEIIHDEFFDTVAVKVSPDQYKEILARASDEAVAIREFSDSVLTVSVDEACTCEDLSILLRVFGVEGACPVKEILTNAKKSLRGLLRDSEPLSHSVFSKYQSETEFLRYIRRLESRDLSLGTSMIPLGSCTMKLNATSEMLPVSWPEISSVHPFLDSSDVEGYREIFEDLESALSEITGFHSISLQPNAGAQGEYAGLLVVRKYHEERGDLDRNVCLIPKSAHGTNPASAVLAGMKVVVVNSDEEGRIDVGHLKELAEKHKETLSCIMITYPSTHGVFEKGIKDICSIVHDAGGQVYLDGANLNALVGLAKPGEFGADVCHINLHKTFCIPHGGGGPGMGPIGVAEHLAPFLPGHDVVDLGRPKAIGQVSAAPWGSASILPISWMYIAMMGAAGLKKATQVAILNANYIASRLGDAYPVLFRGDHGLVAHECILDLRKFKESAEIEVEDVAKRLMDYGFHAPTVSWPVPGTMMVEPTESEGKGEIDRFCDALLAIRAEIQEIEDKLLPQDNNPLKNAPHTALDVTGDDWDRPYSRERAAFPTTDSKNYKFWPAVARIDSVYGDKNVFCTCLDLDSVT